MLWHVVLLLLSLILLSGCTLKPAEAPFALATALRPGVAQPAQALDRTRDDLLRERQETHARWREAVTAARADYVDPVRVDPLLPSPAYVPPVWRQLDAAVRAEAASFAGRLSVTAIDLTTGDRYDFRPHDRYLPASTFKLPVTICTVEAIERGELTWESLITFTKPDDDTVGQGAFAWAEYGSQYTVRNLLDRSIISSNNVAVKMLARTLTWDGLKQCTAGMGGLITRTEAGSTAVTAGDEAAWWLAVWRMAQERPKVAENLLTPLRAVTYTGRLQAGTPRPDLVTHKFGTFPPYENDGAIIWGEKPYVLVMMTATNDHYGVDAAFMRVAGAAWQSINN
ncbi:MAG: serine hydrolase [Mycobacterium leprae]